MFSKRANINFESGPRAQFRPPAKMVNNNYGLNTPRVNVKHSSRHRTSMENAVKCNPIFAIYIYNLSDIKKINIRFTKQERATLISVTLFNINLMTLSYWPANYTQFKYFLILMKPFYRSHYLFYIITIENITKKGIIKNNYF